MGSGGNLPVGPGIWGFIAFFVLAISLWLLVRNMNTRLRRMAYRDRDEAAARADADGVKIAPSDETAVDGESDGPARDDAARDVPGGDDRQPPRAN
jgi:hypothetical protein